jgi:hypothetical protein
LLPALNFTLNKNIGQQDFIEPKIDIIEPKRCSHDLFELRIISDFSGYVNLLFFKKNRKDFSTAIRARELDFRNFF